ncbi:metallophosphoesterase [Methylocapsa sp. S129]|uniref:metallophosphoesterase family protein n=1 Tax=Methylocapsa sp. S129 TaxID=1641869 RepID=UPI00131D3DEB|nr:metallophosphoesterase [Methylocapsa sp. S129]
MSFTIAHLSDPHLGPLPAFRLRDFTAKRAMGYVNWKRGRERLNDMGMLKRLVADMAGQKPDHVAMTGDVVNIGLPAEFAAAAAWMHTLGNSRDVSFTPGNHDAYAHRSMPYLTAALAPWTTSDDGEGRPPGAFPFLRVRGHVALIGLSSGVPTGPLMATGRMGKSQMARFARLLDETRARGLARVVLIHHPPLLAGATTMRNLTDARDFEAVIAEHGAEVILHGHNHKRSVAHLKSDAAATLSGRIPVIGVPSASSTSKAARQRAAYHLIRLEPEGGAWRISVRARGLMPNGGEIGERDEIAV